MKVSELIRQLEQFSPEHEVVIDLGMEDEIDTSQYDTLAIPVRVYEGSHWNVVISLE